MVSDNDGANLAYAATFNGEQDVYFLALGDLAAGRTARAAEQLSKLIAACPNHWHGRLLLAWIEGRNGATRRAEALVAEDPADPRAAAGIVAAIAGARERSALADREAAAGVVSPASLLRDRWIGRGHLLAAVRVAASFEFPTADIDQMLAEIEAGRS